LPRRKKTISLSQIRKTHVDIAKILTEGGSPDDIEKRMLVLEVAAQATRQKQLEFDELLRKKWTEYCELMALSPKVREIFKELLIKREALNKIGNEIYEQIFNKSKGLKSYFLKNEVKTLKLKKDAINKEINEVEGLIRERLDRYYPNVMEKVLANEDVVEMLKSFPFQMEIKHQKIKFEKNPVYGTWDDFFYRFKTANLPTVIASGHLGWAVKYTDEVIAAMKAQIPNAKRRQNNARLKAQAAENKDAQRNLISTFRTQNAFEMQCNKFSSCPYCNSSFESKKLDSTIHLDHIYPVSKGGHSVAENLVFICSSCNSEKSNLTLAIFCDRYGYDRENVTKTLLKLGKEV